MKKKIVRMFLLVTMLASVFIIGSSAYYWADHCPYTNSIYNDFIATASMSTYGSSGGWASMSATLRIGHSSRQASLSSDYYIGYVGGTFSNIYSKRQTNYFLSGEQLMISSDTYYRDTSKTIDHVVSVCGIFVDANNNWYTNITKINGIDFSIYD